MNNPALCIPPDPVTPFAEIETLRAEVASLRLTLGGKTFSATIPGVIGCPMPGMCAQVAEIERLRSEVVRLNAYWHETNVAWFSALARHNDTDLVTVRRSDLFAMLENAIPHALTAWLQSRIKKMEEDAK